MHLIQIAQPDEVNFKTSKKIRTYTPGNVICRIACLDNKEAFWIFVKRITLQIIIIIILNYRFSFFFI